MMTEFRCGTIAIIGRPSTGKSTLLNRLVGEKLAIVSRKPQTTRHLLHGILTTKDCQYVFVDSPGTQSRSRSALQRVLNRRAGEAAREADVAAVVLDARTIAPEDRALLDSIENGTKRVAVLNKTDLIGDRRSVLPLIDTLSKSWAFEAIVPISALTGQNVEELLKVFRSLLPVGPALYPDSQLTDRDERFFAAELLREKLYRQLGRELPYRCEVVIDEFREEKHLRHISATILVERNSQKGIVVGAKGERLKRMATSARVDMERLFGGKVFLNVWVKVRAGWSDDDRVLRQLGYG